jgi:hypothetical protein
MAMPPAPEIGLITCECPRLRRLALLPLPVVDEELLPDLVQQWLLLKHLELEANPLTLLYS